MDFAFHQRRLDKQTCSSKRHSFLRLSTKRSRSPAPKGPICSPRQQETSNDPKPCTTRALRHQASNFKQRYATMMIKYDYLSWIVFLSHSCGVHQSDQQQEQILHLIRTEELKATRCVIVDDKCEFQHSSSRCDCNFDARLVSKNAERPTNYRVRDSSG